MASFWLSIFADTPANLTTLWCLLVHFSVEAHHDRAVDSVMPFCSPFARICVFLSGVGLLWDRAEVGCALNAFERELLKDLQSPAKECGLGCLLCNMEDESAIVLPLLVATQLHFASIAVSCLYPFLFLLLCHCPFRFLLHATFFFLLFYCLQCCVLFFFINFCFALCSHCLMS